MENKTPQPYKDDINTNGLFQALRKKERLMIGFGVLIMLIVTVIDVIEDQAQGADAVSIFADLMYMGIMVCLLLYLWVLVPFSLAKENAMLQREVRTSHRDLDAWRARAGELLAGLGKMVNEQFEQWELSLAEKEVGLMLLKGLSIKQIAAIRNTSDQTVRQQSMSIYSKARITGRAELSAFFLEDLLLPINGLRQDAPG